MSPVCRWYSNPIDLNALYSTAIIQ
uniref:Uncharacterized protein n=1 Tax=Anguilla anguilla TaxID=7936 RepID=A0A0E9THN4_ANGAN